MQAIEQRDRKHEGHPPHHQAAAEPVHLVVRFADRGVAHLPADEEGPDGSRQRTKHGLGLDPDERHDVVAAQYAHSHGQLARLHKGHDLSVAFHKVHSGRANPDARCAPSQPSSVALARALIQRRACSG